MGDANPMESPAYSIWPCGNFDLDPVSTIIIGLEKIFMALPTSYLLTVKNVTAFFDSLITAKAPETFTQKFLEGLGFKSTNDRLFIALLKALNFLDSNAAPTERYFKFLDQSQSKAIMAEALEEAYSDLFAVNTKAYNLPVDEVKSKLRTLTQGKNSDTVIAAMANTFLTLAGYAEWKVAQKPPKEDKKPEEKDQKKDAAKPEVETPPVVKDPAIIPLNVPNPAFHYNIQIHLPESRDQAVYDAIFKSIRSHLF